MAYSARFAQNSWTYDPNGTDFNARVGRLLAGGQNLQETLRKQAVDSVMSLREFEKEQTAGKNTIPGAQIASLINAPTSSGRKEPDATGYVWVDEKGSYMGDLPGSHPPPLKAEEVAPNLSWSQKLYMGMDPTTRSMHMWRRVNPGMLPGAAKWPPSAMKDHFQYRGESTLPVDKSRHLQKTEFTEYANMAIKGKDAGTGR